MSRRDIPFRSITPLQIYVSLPSIVGFHHVVVNESWMTKKAQNSLPSFHVAKVSSADPLAPLFLA